MIKTVRTGGKTCGKIDTSYFSPTLQVFRSRIFQGGGHLGYFPEWTSFFEKNHFFLQQLLFDTTSPYI